MNTKLLSILTTIIIVSWFVCEDLLAAVDLELGGHAKLRGSISWPDDDSFYQLIGTDPYYDGSTELRTKAKLFMSDSAYAEVHYEMISMGGDTRRRTGRLDSSFSDRGLIRGVGIFPLDDNRRLFDLSKVIHDTDSSALYHRVDRLSLTFLPNWGLVRIGRQAVTWGNGLIFNPMDLFNPFAPTDVEREYKVGDDMVAAHISLNDRSDLQLLYVCRRNPDTRSLTLDQSSFAAKLHIAIGTTECDLMGTRHYDDYVVGIGSTGYLKDAAWRCDATWTFLKGKTNLDGFLSVVANMDYSWVWFDKNLYGLVEFYYNGVGEPRGQYDDALTDPYISERLARGELFALGRFYCSGSVGVELHPLFNIYLTVINNLADPSGIVQPRFIWDLFENVQVTGGFNVLYGERDTEYGGFTIPDTDYLLKGADSAYLWVAYYF